MGYTDYQVSERVVNRDPVLLYRWTPVQSDSGESALLPFFLRTEWQNERVPPGTVARVIGPHILVDGWMTYELEVEVSSHPGLEIGRRFIVQNLDSVRWAPAP